MLAVADRQLYDREFRADLRAGAEDLDYDPPQLPDFSPAKAPRNKLRRQMSQDEARGAIAMKRLAAKPFPNTAGGSF